MKWRLDDGQIEVVDDAVAEILRRRTIAERAAMVSECNHTMRTIVEAGVRYRHADWSEERIMREVARRMSGGTD